MIAVLVLVVGLALFASQRSHRVTGHPVPIVPATLAPLNTAPPVVATGSTAPGTAVAGAPGPAGRGCGVERWAVKTGTDAAARQVDATPHATTVAELRALPAPVNPVTRVAPVEETVYQLRAILTDYKIENDSDEHLVLLDPGGSGTLVAEIPAPSCLGSASAFGEAIAMARAAFDARFHATDRYQHADVAVTVTGVGFFDRVHGQRGVAANGIELHPVLSLTFG